MRSIGLAVMVATAMVAMGCQQHLYSPPAQIPNVELAAPTPQGKMSVGVRGGVQQAIFGFQLHGGAAQLRHGVTETTELGVDGTVMNIAEDGGAVETDSTILAGRFGGKTAPEELGEYLAVTYGIGGGTSAAGDFISPDAGLVLSYEWLWWESVTTLSGFASIPVDAREVDISTESQGPGTHVQAPGLTFGATLAAGAMKPIELDSAIISPFVHISITGMTDRVEEAYVAGLQGGVNLEF